MNNEIYLQNEIIKEPIIRSRYKNKDLYIKCKICLKLNRIKSLTKNHLTKDYNCFTCRGLYFNPFKGKKHTQESKDKLSKNKKGKKSNTIHKSNYEYWLLKYGKEKADIKIKESSRKISFSNSGKNNPFYGKKHSKETIEKIVKKTKNTIQNRTKQQQEEIRKKISLSHKKQKEKNFEKYIRDKIKAGKISSSKNEKYKINKLEKIVYNELKKRNIEFVYSVIIGHYQYDFGNKKHKILLEVNGDYWHSNPNIYKSKNLTQELISLKDGKKWLFAQKHKLKLFVIWEEDIKNNNFEILDEIKRFINEV